MQSFLKFWNLHKLKFRKKALIFVCQFPPQLDFKTVFYLSFKLFNYVREVILTLFEWNMHGSWWFSDKQFEDYWKTLKVSFSAIAQLLSIHFYKLTSIFSALWVLHSLHGTIGGMVWTNYSVPCPAKFEVKLIRKNHKFTDFNTITYYPKYVHIDISVY
mgnify:CR=1 FL=1